LATFSAWLQRTQQQTKPIICEKSEMRPLFFMGGNMFKMNITETEQNQNVMSAMLLL
jgi:hypothetical protein